VAVNECCRRTVDERADQFYARVPPGGAVSVFCAKCGGDSGTTRGENPPSDYEGVSVTFSCPSCRHFMVAKLRG